MQRLQPPTDQEQGHLRAAEVRMTGLGIFKLGAAMLNGVAACGTLLIKRYTISLGKRMS